MNLNLIISQDIRKIIERLFVFVQSKDIQLNTHINLAVNPEVLKILFTQLNSESKQLKIAIMTQLSDIYAKNMLNSLILAKRDRQIVQFNYCILDDLVTFILQSKISMSDVELFGNLFRPFVHRYPITCKNIKNITQKIAKDFYFEKFTSEKLALSIKILKILLQSQIQKPHQPQSYFMFYGENSGLRMISEKSKWSLAKGFYFYIWFYICQHPKHPNMQLLEINVNDDQFMLFIDQENMLRIKVFSVARKFPLRTMQVNKWHTIKLTYLLKTGFLGNCFDMITYIEGQPYELKDLPVPDLGIRDEIQQLSIGKDFYGLINCAIIARQDIKEVPLYGIGNRQNLDKFLLTNRKFLKNIYLLYTPLISTQYNQKQIVYDVATKNHAQLLQNTGIHINPFKDVDIDYYGGLYNFLPFFHLLKFYKYQNYPSALEDLLNLIIIPFNQNFKGVQQQALNCQFFSILSFFVNQMESQFLTIESVNLFYKLRGSISLQALQKDFFKNFLWRINIKKINKPLIVQKIFSITIQQYRQDLEGCLNFFPVQAILRYLIENCQPQKPQNCCLQHWFQCNTPVLHYQEVITIQEHYKLKGGKIQKILSEILEALGPSHKQQPRMYLLHQKFNIMKFLLHKYSICFRSIILKSIEESMDHDPLLYIKELNILSYMYALLAQAQLKDQFTPIMRILAKCLKVVKEQTKSQIMGQINDQLDKLYLRKYSDIKLRSKSQRIYRQVRDPNRKYSEQIQKPSLNQKDKLVKDKLIKLKTDKKTTIQNDEELYQIIIGMCFGRIQGYQELVLIDDQYILILQPYFKLCAVKFRVMIIEMIKNTVLLSEKSFDNLTRLYKFMVMQFVQKELDPSLPQYLPSNQTNYIIKNVYFIVDHVVMALRNDWNSLYVYIIQLTALLEQSKKQLVKRTSRSSYEVLRAAKLTVRKFVLRIVKYAQEQVQNFPNLIFLVYITIFNNMRKQQPKQALIFDYFSRLEPYLFLDTFTILDNGNHMQTKNISFVDYKLILAAVSTLKLENLKLSDSQKLMNRVRGYLSAQQQSLTRLRKIFISRADFKQLDQQTKNGFRGVFFHLLSNQGQDKNDVGLNLCVGQIISLLLGLCIESSIHCQQLNILRESLFQLQQFFKSFILACSRDGLKRQTTSQRNKTTPINLSYNIIHFLYAMMENELDFAYNESIEETLWRMLSFLGILVTVLNQKLGNPDSVQQALMLSQILKDVEQYNYFSLQILSGVMSMSDIKQYPNLNKQKALHVLQYKQLKNHFRKTPQSMIEKQLRQLTQIHRNNISKYIKEISVRIDRLDPAQDLRKYSLALYSHDQFQQTLLNYLRDQNLHYRKTMRIWRKLWKRLRNGSALKFLKNWTKQKSPYKRKFSKITDHAGLRSILELEPNQPWHVRKTIIEQQIRYRSNNFLFNLYKNNESQQRRQKSFFEKVFMKPTQGQQFVVKWIKHNSKRKGSLSLSNQKLIFIYDSTFQKDSHMDFTSFTLAEYKPIKKQWDLVGIVQIYKRRYITKNDCLLIEFQDSTSLLFHFPYQDATQFLKLIQLKQQSKLEKINFLKSNKVKFYTQKIIVGENNVQNALESWRQNKITTLEYLMILNKLSGRSYLDPVHYPVVPWILADYQGNQITYRPLHKTLGGLGTQTRKQFYKNKTQAIDPFNPVPAYQYGTHYSSPGVVFNFLVRLSPYTQAAKTLQGGRFDLSDRLFHSMKWCWFSVTHEVSDVRQLVPQFFYLPQFLLNIQNHDFGMTQQGERVHHVKLPQWARNAYQFITIQRRAMESQKVSQNIQNWIDLIFGFKQKGKIAEENLNLYYYLTYQDAIDLEKVSDQVEKISIEAQIIHFGQTPSQLFKKNHPGKYQLPSTQLFSFKKVKFIGSLESNNPIQFLYKKGSKIFLFKDSTILSIQYLKQFKVEVLHELLRGCSKQNLFHVEDITSDRRVSVFGNDKFIAIGAYVNGDLVLYCLSTGTKIQSKKGFVKNIIYINNDQNLLMCGCKNGLLEVYQIIYGDKETLSLIKISSQYYMFPIQHISQGGGFVVISSGNLSIICKISRGMAYVHDKVKMKGCKMVRSIQSKRKILGSFIVTNPLTCLVFYNSLELYVYSINGQLLKSKQIQTKLPPLIIKDQSLFQYILILHDKNITIYTLPELQVCKCIAVPSKDYIDIQIRDKTIFLISSMGELLYVTQEKQI